MRKLKTQIKDLSSFESFRIENCKAIVGGLGDTPPSGSGNTTGGDGGIIDPVHGSTTGGGRP